MKRRGRGRGCRGSAQPAPPSHRGRRPLCRNCWRVWPNRRSPTPDSALYRLQSVSVAPAGGGLSLQVAVAALASDDRYLAASSQEALLLCFAGEAAAAQISAGAAAFNALSIAVTGDDQAGPQVDAHVASVANRAARARGRGRRGRGGRGRGNRQIPGTSAIAGPPQLDTDGDRAPEAGTQRSQPRQSRATPVGLPALLPTMRDVHLAEEVHKRVYTFQTPPR